MSFLPDFFTAMFHGASTVYHEVLAAEQEVVKWTHDNPILGALLEKGVETGNMFLQAHGVPTQALTVAIPAVVSGLRVLAAQDATVNSANPTSIVSSVVNAAAGIAEVVNAASPNVFGLNLGNSNSLPNVADELAKAGLPPDNPPATP
jgi:hypothetical protein